jgi:hypothetical protein
MAHLTLGESVQRLADLGAQSALAYAADSAKATICDDGDRRASELVRELRAKEAHYVELIRSLAEEFRCRSMPRPFDLRTSYLNFARMTTIAARLVEDLPREIAALEGLALDSADKSSVADRVRHLARDLVALRVEGRRRLEELLRSLKPALPAAAAPTVVASAARPDAAAVAKPAAAAGAEKPPASAG